MSIDVKFIFEVLLWISFFNPQIVSSNISQIWNLLGNVLDALRLAYLFLFFTKALTVHSKRNKMNNIVLAEILCAIAVFIVTSLNGDFSVLKSVIIRYTSCIGAMCLVYDKRNHFVDLIKTLFIASEILIYANAISMLLFPNGIYIVNIITPCWILGQKQNFVYVYPMALFAALIVFKADIYKFRSVALMVCTAATLIYAIPVGLLLTMAGTFIICILPARFRRLFKTQYFVALVIVFMIAIIYMAFNYESMDFLQQLLLLINTGGMRKTKTILSRTYMWKDAILTWIHHPVFGVGMMSEARYDEVMLYSTYHPVIHNTYLDLLCSGGLVALSIFVYMNHVAIKRLKATEHWLSWIIIVNIFAMWVLMLTEGLYGTSYVLLIFAEYNRQFSTQIDEYNRSRIKRRKVVFR